MAISARGRLLLWGPLGLVSGLAVSLAGLLLLAPPRATAVDSGPTCTPLEPCLALVIDDVGRDAQALRGLLAIPADLTFSVLPHARHSELSRRAVVASGRELLLHLPMDPLDRGAITDEPLVVGRDGRPGDGTRRCLAQVPEAVGVNNHMGSALTQQAEAVAAVVAAVKARGLFFLDSRTSERSVLCEVARARGVPCFERDVFLDDPPAPAALTSAWERVRVAAGRRGWAIAIAHPHASTVAMLRELLGRKELHLVRLSRLLVHLTQQDAGI